MAKIIGSAPVLLVRDVVAAAEYYRDKLGFQFSRYWGEPACFCMPQRDGHIVMLSEAPKEATLTPHWKVVDKMWNAYFWVDDIDALYEEFKQRGAKIDYELCDQPYGVREFGVQDLDDHDIAFGQDMEE